VIDEGLAVGEEGNLTNKNSAVQSKAGTRKNSDDDDCEIHTSSDDNSREAKSKMGQT